MALVSRRLQSNADGDFYVDASCIDCGACRWVAPATFDFAGDASRVHTQPRTAAEAGAALQALVACPTASIGTVAKHDVRAAAATFPLPVAPDVYYCGYHHEGSFGAASYLIVRPEGNVLVDSPRFAAPLVKRIAALGGVRWMFLTHRDDVADHERFAARFGCARILHCDDISPSTRAVEIQPAGTEPVELGPNLTMIPVPGHTRGSACLLYRGTLFSGDHVSWSIERRRVTAFGDACWYDWGAQIESMQRLVSHDFEHILPGHGAPCHMSPAEMKDEVRACVAWMRRRAA